MAEHAVAIAGGGPTGLTLAGELALAGVDVVIVERRTSQDLDASRAGGLQARTLEVLDQRGIVERFLAAGQPAQVQAFVVPLDISDFPTRHPHGLALWQREFEPILAGWVLEELGVPILRGREVVGFTSDGDGVDVELSSGAPLRVRYLVGCDGGRSVVRKAAGIDFPGSDATTSWMIAQVDLDDPQIGVRPEGGGIGPVHRVEGGNPYGVVLKERPAVDGEPTFADLRAALVAAYGTDFGVRAPAYISRFTDVARHAASYRAGRVLLAGDAAHVHPPQGGQGLNIGVQDAVNLGWKLARVVHGLAPESLLDTYHSERHPIGARVLQSALAAVALSETDAPHQAARDVVGDLLGIDAARTVLAARLSGLDVHYDIEGDHPLVGRRMPDLDIEIGGRGTRVFTLLHEARPVLLSLGRPIAFDLDGWPRVQRVGARNDDDAWELPVLGAVRAPRAVLIRPDGYVAWAGDPDDPALRHALARWFG